MAFHLQGSSSNRTSEVGQLIESFIDDNKEDFSMTQIGILEGLAEQVDDLGKEQEQTLTDKQNIIEEQAGKIEELEGEIE
ncbi:hydrogenase maturation protease [Bacillus phage BCPST]|uniref:Hydrogenase maturation protease n=2 Tax=Yihwangvirus TaxID=3044863 RepID=A0AAE7P5N8_9CAUD|nr:hypothetical protein PP655_gp034 [Bacillus phage PBC4]YP_010657313.1 hydrogenase maturation protease [Bacillus phage BCPST]AKQ08226.1 hypothetical protein PBC4_034 [Bacillus phage PBC4]QQO38678.1 hydrogenase maturation protease [Bacillus phage BCPST]QSJ04270.1 hydrogenase maturation protease [Bacillus phage BCP6]